MNNSDQPIHALDDLYDKKTGKEVHGLIGLTKREHFAGLALQGLCACDVNNSCTYSDNAEMAVKMADALLKELEK